MIQDLPVIKGCVLEISSGQMEGGLPLCSAIPLWVPRKAVRAIESRIVVRCALSTLSGVNNRGSGEPRRGLGRTIRVLEDMESDRAKAAVLLCASILGEVRTDEISTVQSVLAQYAGFASPSALWPSRTRHALPLSLGYDTSKGSPIWPALRVLHVIEHYAPLIVQPIEAFRPSSPSLSEFQKTFPEGTGTADWSPRGRDAWQRLTTQRLSEMVWEKPMSHLALELGVSNTTIRKTCVRKGIEIPPPNYWGYGPKSKRGIAVE
jgi:hypothetical protein